MFLTDKNDSAVLEPENIKVLNFTDMQDYQIFIIDDSRIQLIILEKVLKRAGFSVRVFTDGYKLIDRLEETKPDLVISDIDMPKLNGFEMIEEIKKRYGNVDFPFFFISSSWTSKVEKKAESIGAEILFEKPFKFEVMIDEIERTLKLTPKSSSA